MYITVCSADYMWNVKDSGKVLVRGGPKKKKDSSVFINHSLLIDIM